MDCSNNTHTQAAVVTALAQEHFRDRDTHVMLFLRVLMVPNVETEAVRGSLLLDSRLVDILRAHNVLKVFLIAK